jgi:hypothetical protein
MYDAVLHSVSFDQMAENCAEVSKIYAKCNGAQPPSPTAAAQGEATPILQDECKFLKEQPLCEEDLIEMGFARRLMAGTGWQTTNSMCDAVYYYEKDRIAINATKYWTWFLDGEQRNDIAVSTKNQLIELLNKNNQNSEPEAAAPQGEELKLNYWHLVDKYSPGLLSKYSSYKNKRTGSWEVDEDELLELLHEIVCDTVAPLTAELSQTKERMQAEAVEFADWVHKNALLLPDNNYRLRKDVPPYCTTNQMQEMTPYTTAELYKIWKEQTQS